MFAVIKTGGKQYRVVADDVISVDKVTGNPGDIVEFASVLVVGGDNVRLGTPTVAGASVAAEVIEQGRGAKIIAFKKRRRKNSRRKRGHRQEFTLVRITEILTDGKKPTLRPKAEANVGDMAPAPSAEGESGAEATSGAEAAEQKASAARTKKAQSKPETAAKPAAAAAKKPSRPTKEKGESKGKKK